jgi:hypothetical protein
MNHAPNEDFAALIIDARAGFGSSANDRSNVPAAQVRRGNSTVKFRSPTARDVSGGVQGVRFHGMIHFFVDFLLRTSLAVTLVQQLRIEWRSFFS